jgi:translation elongation factor EF-Ts
MVGRIETYVHSDTLTPNKGAAVVKVVCDTDFAAKTPAFVDFAKRCARMAYAASSTSWAGVQELFPDLEDARQELAQALHERVEVAEIQLVHL